MQKYEVNVFDIKDIKKHKHLEQFMVNAWNKGEAQDKAHKIADEKYPKRAIMVSIRDIGCAH